MKIRPLWIIGIILIFVITWTYQQTNRMAEYNNSGVASIANRDWRDARLNFFNAQVLAPDEPLPYFNYAHLLISQNNWTDAEYALLQAIRRGDEQTSWRAYYNLGNLYYGVGEYNRAIETYQEALRLNPQSDNARYNLELALRRAVQSTPTPTPVSNMPPTPTPTPDDTNGNTPTDNQGGGDIIEVLPTQDFIGVSVEEAENLLDQLRLEEQALGQIPLSNDVSLPEKDW